MTTPLVGGVVAHKRDLFDGSPHKRNLAVLDHLHERVDGQDQKWELKEGKDNHEGADIVVHNRVHRQSVQEDQWTERNQEEGGGAYELETRQVRKYHQDHAYEEQNRSQEHEALVSIGEQLH